MLTGIFIDEYKLGMQCYCEPGNDGQKTIQGEVDKVNRPGNMISRKTFQPAHLINCHICS